MMPWIQQDQAAGGEEPRQDTDVRLDELTDELLRSALRAKDGGEASDIHVREALRQVCDAAHAHDVHAEELLVLIKARWNHLPEATRSMGAGRDALLARVISSCIRVFYSRGTPSSTQR